MKTQIIFCLLIITLASFSIQAQTKVEPAWVKHFGSCQPPENNAASSMEVDRFGNVYVTGYKGDSLEASRDYATIKYDTDGIEEWIQLYNGEGNGKDEAIALAVDPAGNSYITGTSFTSSGNRYVTSKFNSAGSQRWISIGYYNYSCNATALALDFGINTYVIGVDQWSHCLVFKFNQVGGKIWDELTINWDGSCQSLPLIDVSINGNIYVAHMSSGNYFIKKFDEYGSGQASAYYNGTGNYYDKPTALVIDDSSNVYIAGYSGGIGTGYDFATIKYNSNLDQKWVARYNNEPGNPDDNAVAVKVDTSGNVYVTGRSWDILTSNDYATVKYDRNGVEQWVARYNDPCNSDDFPTAMVLDMAGNIYITGYSLLDTDTTYSYLTVKYNPAGELQWAMRYDHPSHANDYARDIAVDDSGNVYVTGTSYGNGWSAYTTIKYIQNLVPLFSILPETIEFGQVMLNSADTISVVISNPGTDTLIISNMVVTDSNEFVILPTQMPINIPSNGQKIIQIVFQPNSIGLKTAQIIFYHNAASTPDTVQVRGEALGAVCAVEPANIDFGKVAVNTAKDTLVTISNKGNIPIIIDSLALNEPAFAVHQDSTIIPPGGKITIQISFSPYVKEMYADSLAIYYHAANISGITIISLQGQGIEGTMVDETPGILQPRKFVLHQNYPNPFNPSTTISYSLPKTSQVILKIFDILGHEIAALVNEKQSAGEYEIEWNATDFQSGVYVCRLQAGEFSAVMKLILLK